MKRAFIGILMLAVQISVAVAQADDKYMIYFSCGFEDGLPSSAQVYDEDGFELHYTMTQNGFSKTDSWIWQREDGRGNHYAARVLSNLDSWNGSESELGKQVCKRPVVTSELV